jgi:simple sugar transport system permease protein
MIEPELLFGFLAAAIRIATPLAFAAVGEVIAERGGVLNLGIEGAMLAGALAAAVVATSIPGVGGAGAVMAAMIAGLLISAVVAAVAVVGRADQVITGTAVTLGALGLTGLLAQRFFGMGGAGLEFDTMAPVPLPLLADIPGIGRVLFHQPVLTYLAYLVVPGAAWLLFRTRFGLELRAAGESPAAAQASGVRVTWVRSAGVLLGGLLAGLAGATLVLAQVGTFTERMTAGRGFIAIAIVVLGRWQPLGAALAALLFGLATALQYLVQASGWELVPYQFFIALPYLLALAALASKRARSKAPAALGVSAPAD